MDDEIKFLRRPVDTLRLGLAAAREVGSSKTKHPVQAMQEEVRGETERRRSRSDDAGMKNLYRGAARGFDRGLENVRFDFLCATTNERWGLKPATC